MDLEFRKGILFVRFNGYLNKQNYLDNKLNLEDIIKKLGIRYLVVNLEEVIDLDRFGLNLVVNNYKRLTNNNGKLLICGNLSDRVDQKMKQSLYLKSGSFINNELLAFEIIER